MLIINFVKVVEKKMLIREENKLNKINFQKKNNDFFLLMSINSQFIDHNSYFFLDLIVLIISLS